MSGYLIYKDNRVQAVFCGNNEDAKKVMNNLKGVDEYSWMVENNIPRISNVYSHLFCWYLVPVEVYKSLDDYFN